MAFGSEVDNSTRAMFSQNTCDQGAVANIAWYEEMAGVALHIGEVVQVACVGEFIEVDDWLVTTRQPVQYEVGTDKTGAAGY